jgi:dTDP-4-amino-4,6-dideoxygalactose transaminase
MIPLVQPLVGAEEKKIISKIIDSRILASGEYVKQFEDACALHFNTKFCVAVSSGTTALHAALLACGIKQGDKVLTTPLSFIATANSILFCGAKPVFADIDPVTFNLSPRSAEEALKKDKSIKAIIVVHLYGMPADMKEFVRLKKKYDVALIEDCAQAHGAKCYGRIVGSIGDASAFSFYATKNIMTGEGGTIHTNNQLIDKRVRQIINHGREGHSTHTVLGFNFRLTNIAAGIGIVQLKKLDKWNAMRRKNAEYLTRSLETLPFLRTPVIPSNFEPVFHQYTLRVTPGLRAEFMKHLAKKGVGCGIYYSDVIYRQPLYQKLGYKKGSCPEAEKAVEEVVSIPVHPALSKKDLVSIVDGIRSFKG